jgi:hypothetical protein
MGGEPMWRLLGVSWDTIRSWLSEVAMGHVVSDCAQETKKKPPKPRLLQRHS